MLKTDAFAPVDLYVLPKEDPSIHRALGRRDPPRRRARRCHGRATAHVTVNPLEASRGGYTKLTVRVPNESDDAATILCK
jgi:hypothetical protein